jgi:two-component system, cell cycle sensor histidine kinase and response regulator CckA
MSFHLEDVARALFEEAGDALFLLDPKSGRVVAANATAQELSGFALEDLIGRRAGELFRSEKEGGLERMRVASKRTGTFHSQEGYLLRYRDEGVWIPVNLTITRLHVEPTPLGLITARDIRARLKAEARLKNAEDELRQAQKMEAIGQLAGGVAHDFNNLLTAILGNVGLLLESKSVADADREALTAIEAAAMRAAELTRQLLGFSRQAVWRPQTVNLNHTVQEVLRILKHAFDPRLTLNVVIEPALWPVQADPTGMGQVLMNLCLNARDAMSAGGTLTLRTENVVCEDKKHGSEMHKGEYVRLRVADTGIGIPAEIRSRIFEPFFTTKGPGKGTGLGLAVVFGIVQQHHGRIVCASEPGQGACFDVYLPRSGTAAAPVSPPVQPAIVPGHETILLIDDEAIIRNLGRTLLRRQGYTVLLAEDGPQAIEMYRQNRNRIDLVILDLTMPRLSGQETLKQLREIDPSVPVLFSSGYSADGMPDATEEQVLGFIGKPYRPQELAAAVRSALHRAETVKRS